MVTAYNILCPITRPKEDIMPRIIDLQKNNIIGENLRRERIRQKISQKALSDRLETLAIYVCRGSISRIESGERTVTDIEIDGICRVLNISLDELFYGNK